MAEIKIKLTSGGVIVVNEGRLKELQKKNKIAFIVSWRESSNPHWKRHIKEM